MLYIFLKNDFIYLFLERGEKRKKEGERNVNWLLLTCPQWGPGPQSRHLPWLGITPATLRFAGQGSIL